MTLMPMESAVRAIIALPGEKSIKTRAWFSHSSCARILGCISMWNNTTLPSASVQPASGFSSLHSSDSLSAAAAAAAAGVAGAAAAGAALAPALFLPTPGFHRSVPTMFLNTASRSLHETLCMAAVSKMGAFCTVLKAVFARHESPRGRASILPALGTLNDVEVHLCLGIPGRNTTY